MRVRVGALIENAGCFPGSSVYRNLRMQTINPGLKDPEGKIRRVLEIVRMEEHAHLKFKSCSLGMKQRVGIAMAFMGVAAKQKAWLALCGSLGGGMLLFMTVSMITPLSATALHVALCPAGGVLFASGLGAISKAVPGKTALV